MGRSVQAPLAERRSTAAFSVGEQEHVEACGLEHSDCGDADVWLVVPDKGVVPKDYRTTSGWRRRRPLSKQTIETLMCVSWERPLGSEPDRLLQQVTDRPQLQQGVGQRRREAAQSTENRDRAAESLACGKSMALMPGVEQFRLEQCHVNIRWALSNACLAAEAIAERQFKRGSKKWVAPDVSSPVLK